MVTTATGTRIEAHTSNSMCRQRSQQSVKAQHLGGVKILVNAKYRGRFMFRTTKKIEEAFFDAV